MNVRPRQIAVLVFASLDIASSVWLGSSLDQGADPTPVYFLPFGPTFAIWGLIFASQLVYAVYQMLPSQRDRRIHQRIGGWVALNAALTALWNFVAGTAGQPDSPAFQPLLVAATAVVLVIMLFALTQVFIAFRALDSEFTRRDRWLVQFPLTVFFAWLNVAMIANTTAALAAVGFTGEPNGALWATGMLLAAALVASLMIRFTRAPIVTITYTAVIVWAVIGILANNVARSSLVVAACVFSAAVVLAVAGWHLSRPRPTSPSAQPVSA